MKTKLDQRNALRYIPLVLKGFIQTITLITLLSPSLSLWARSPGIQNKSHKKGAYVSNSDAMKHWLARMPLGFGAAFKRNVKISNIDIKWKETRTPRFVKAKKSSKGRMIARVKNKTRLVTDYKCELSLTIQYQDSSSNEESPELIATPQPMLIHSSCKSFLAKNKALLSGDFNS